MTKNEGPVDGPLTGITVLDATIFQNGPYATAMLGDMGADVIKIERPLMGDPGRGVITRHGKPALNGYFESNNRNKRSITLNLEQPEGREVFYRLVRGADVVVQNFRVGVAERLGLDFESLKKHNPRIIRASATGLGRKGPDAKHPVFDILGMARSGSLRALQYPESDPEYFVGFGLADQTGAIVLAHAITLALFARERFGIGQDVEISQLGAQLMLQQFAIQGFLFTGNQPRFTTRERSFNPLFNIFPCRDGKWLALACVQADRFWHDICRVLGLESLEDDPRFAEMGARNQHGTELVPELDRAFGRRPRDEWVASLARCGVPVEAVNDYDDLTSDCQVGANDYIVEVDHPSHGRVKAVGIPIRLSETPGKIRRLAPEFGQHTEEVLLEAGYSWEEITALRDKNAL